VDCLAVKQFPEGFKEKWKVSPPMTLEGRIIVALGEISFHNPDVRAYIGRTLKDADQTLLGDARIIQALNNLAIDSKENVRQAVEWWKKGR
jgi:hypothetical protein